MANIGRNKALVLGFGFYINYETPDDPWFNHRDLNLAIPEDKELMPKPSFTKTRERLHNDLLIETKGEEGLKKSQGRPTEHRFLKVTPAGEKYLFKEIASCVLQDGIEVVPVTLIIPEVTEAFFKVLSSSLAIHRILQPSAEELSE